jgi:cytochrome c peroxidase
MLNKTIFHRIFIGSLLLGTAVTAYADMGNSNLLRQMFDASFRFTKQVQYPGLVSQQNNACSPNCPLPATNAIAGQADFGFNSNESAIDSSQGLFQGQSTMLGVGTIVSNGRTCSTCHRPDRRDGSGNLIEALELGLPHAFPLSNTIPSTDPIFTGINADASGNPEAYNNLNNHGLFVYRPGRFNPLLAWNDPLREVLLWRKSIRLVNTGLTFGFLNDARMRELQETARNAIFSHTQPLDQRFDDLLRAPNPNYPTIGPPNFEQRPRDMAAFIELTTINPPILKAFVNPADPTLNPQCAYAPGAPCTPDDCQRLTGNSACDLYTVLITDPFFTVPVQTPAQQRGRDIFKAQCMTCHNTPNVFGNVEHVPGAPLNFGPRIAHTFDVGVAQRNVNNLDFRGYVCTTQPPEGADCPQRVFQTIVLPLAKMDGTTVMYPVTIDPGTAAATGRYEDLQRFKVPQLRGISQLGPYFHDNSATTLDDVLDHFTSPWYANSADGSQYPICLSSDQRSDLLAFLNIL